MKQRYLLTIPGFLSVASLAAICLTLAGCPKSADTNASVGTGTGTPNVNLAKATPPPNFNPAGQIAAQNAAEKASQELRKKVESGAK